MKNLLPAMLLLILFGCADKTDTNERKDGFTPVLKTREDSLFHEVMQGHDVGMAKMGKLSRYTRYTRRAIDSLNQLSAGKSDKQLLQKYSAMLEKFVQADDEMSNWMVNFKVDTLKSDVNAREAYLLSEKIKVERVRDLILESERIGDSVFKKVQ